MGREELILFFNITIFLIIHTQGKFLQIRHTLVPAVSMLKNNTAQY